MSSILQSPTTAPGRFGPYGGRYVPETLMVPLFELERAYEAARADAAFQSRLSDLLKNFAGRPTPLQFASRLTEKLGGPRIYLKREDLLHTGAHKINNAIGQGLLAVKMGKPRIIAETGAGQHGVATAAVAAHLGLECVVYMGTEDMARQALEAAGASALSVLTEGEFFRGSLKNLRDARKAIQIPVLRKEFSGGDWPRSARANRRRGETAAHASVRLRGRGLEFDWFVPSISQRRKRENDWH